MNRNRDSSFLKMVLTILITSTILAAIFVTIIRPPTASLPGTQERLPVVSEDGTLVNAVDTMTVVTGSVIAAQQTKIAIDASNVALEIAPTSTSVALEADSQELALVAEVAPTIPAPTIPAPTVPAPTDAPTNELILGYATRSGCETMTEISQRLIAQRLQLSFSRIQFDNITDLFTAMANGDVDLTFCYSDPVDRTHMLAHLGKIRQVGIRHYEAKEYRLQIWANGNARVQIRKEQPCLLDFLEKVDFTDIYTTGMSIDEFIDANEAIVGQWFDCPYR